MGRQGGWLPRLVRRQGLRRVTPRILGPHRYDVAQGFQPTKVQLVGHTSGSVCQQAEDFFGGPPARRRVSWEVEDWDRPLAMSLQQAG